MSIHRQYFLGSYLFCLVAVGAGFALGGYAAASTVLFLTVLEASLSFDNAVVNAGVLAHWDAVWRRRFLVWGILIAVFGMRLLFPLIIVGVAGDLSPWHALMLAIEAPDAY